MRVNPQKLNWYKKHCYKIIQHCRRNADYVPGLSEKAITVYVPGGDDKYPSFWIRDAVMCCQSGLIDVAEMRIMFNIILSYQNGPERKNLKNGLWINPWAIPDHINLPGLELSEKRLFPGACFFPGTCAVGEDQGEGVFGLRPSDDDIYETVELAGLIVNKIAPPEQKEFLLGKINNITIIERLDSGIKSMFVDDDTGLVWNTPDNWGASNFHDGCKPMGAVGISSVLRFRAVKIMAQLFDLLGNAGKKKEYLQMAGKISHSVCSVLLHPTGWIMAGSEINRQPDVWSTSIAVYEGLLQGQEKQTACEAMLKAYREGTVSKHGYLRHVPTDFDALPGKAVWEHGCRDDEPGGDYEHYQNGGFWPQVTGFYAHALAHVDIDSALQLAQEFIAHTQKYANEGAPFEWINPDISIRECKWYGPSAALPLKPLENLLCIEGIC